VAARARHEPDAEAIRPPDDRADVLAVGGDQDRRRLDAVVAAVEDDAGLVVAAIAGEQDAAAGGGPQRPRLLGREASGLRLLGAGEQRGGGDEQRPPRDPPRVNSLTVVAQAATVA
jgi:hypothetical protein